MKDNFYFHSAKEGKKIDLIELDGRVCFEVDRQIQINPNKRACGWSTKYRSVIGEGKAIVIKDIEEKKRALLSLMKKYSGNKDWKIPQDMLDKVKVVRVDIFNMTGKTSES